MMITVHTVHIPGGGQFVTADQRRAQEVADNHGVNVVTERITVEKPSTAQMVQRTPPRKGGCGC